MLKLKLLTIWLFIDSHVEMVGTPPRKSVCLCQHICISAFSHMMMMQNCYLVYEF